MDGTGLVGLIASPAATVSSRATGSTESGFGTLLGALLGTAPADAPSVSGPTAASEGVQGVEQAALTPCTNVAVPAPEGRCEPCMSGGAILEAGAEDRNDTIIAAAETIVPVALTDASQGVAPEPAAHPVPAETTDRPPSPSPEALPPSASPADVASSEAIRAPRNAPATGSPADHPIAPTYQTDDAPLIADRPPIGTAPAASALTNQARTTRAAEHAAFHHTDAAAPLDASDDAPPAGMSSTIPSVQPVAPQAVATELASASPRRPTTTEQPPEPRDAPQATINIPSVAAVTAPPVPDVSAPSPTRSAARVAPAQQVAPVAIALSLDPDAGGRIALQLDPAELGRVEVVVERTRESTAIHVTAERPETLALLARDGAQLDRALRDAGIGGDGGCSLSFSLLSDGGAGGQPGDPRGGGTGRGWRDAPPPPVETPRKRDLTTLLDIAI